MELRAAIKRLPLATPAYALIRLVLGRNARFAADYGQNSGVGSDLNATKVISVALPSLLSSLSVHSMLDIPCGDFVWMRHVDLGPTTYIGADIIDSLIDSHQRLHMSDKRTFTKLDIATDNLPQVDLIVCRDCLPHFSHRLLKRTVNNIRRSRSRFLLTTTFPQHSPNKGVFTGSWQPLNLCAPPFNFPLPLRLINEGHPPPYTDKSLGLWSIADLPTF
jgi:hypothetical protein